ncbi:uncharacterized protein LOC133523217 [Cydia pomonella]|uniref:uncharacterized protein LOC133523217 n=1 Tax=Cydia pomonella TaxID=82600 RepID=UPI002ADD6339|nr:uncharacterized protein LOC133523217 [Cydia pomonella]
MGVEIDEYKLNQNNDPLPEKVEEAIKKIIKKEGYTAYKFSTKAISTVGGNYFGSLYEVDVVGRTEDGEKETNIFVKGIVPADHLTALSVTEMFKMELFFYNDLAVVLNNMQNEANVPIKERYSTAKSFQESISEAIILDNMAKKGYKTLSRFDVLPVNFAELCVKQLGKLHALSFALENKLPEYFDQHIKTIPCPYNFNEELKGLLRNSSKALSACLDDDAQKRFNAFLPKLWEKSQEYYLDPKYKRTLIHNDYRANNILLKEIDGEIVDIIPVDYQLMHYGCPLLDFFFLIFLGTDQQFRKDHLEDLKDIYFESLTKMLKYFDIDVKSVFPREDFENLYTETLGYGLLCFIHLMPFIFATENNIPDLDKDYLGEVSINTDPRMNERARGIVDDFIRWGVL